MKNFTTNTVDIKTGGGYTLDQVLSNKNVSKNPSFWYLLEHTIELDEPRYLFKSKVAESWEFYDSEIINPIRNTNQIYLRFLDVTAFVEPSNFFRENKKYPFANIPDTLEYNKYWDMLEDIIENGLEVEGVRITGRHYFTINFGRFKAIPVDEFGNATGKNKIWTFLKFIDHQYYIFHELEECLLEGVFSAKNKYLDWFPQKSSDDYELLTKQNFATSKGRRKGWTALIGIGGFGYNFTFRDSSMNLIAAYEKGKYKPLLKAIHTTKSFLDTNTPWKRRTDIKGTNEHFISGVEVTDEYGVKTKVGYMSEVQALSFKDQPFKSVGDSADLINIEEAGIFHNLIQTYQVSMEPLIRDGETRIGVCIVGGTAGDMESGASTGLSDIMHNPAAFGFKHYANIYEEQEGNSESGWFIDDLWYLPVRLRKDEFLKLDSSARTKKYLSINEDRYLSTVDAQGNSYRYLSDLVLENKRLEKRKSSAIAYQKFITQQPKYLSEAFLLNEASPFDTATAKEVLGELAVTKPISRKGVFALSGGVPKFRMDINLVSIDEYNFKGYDTSGCWVIYEDPVLINGKIPTWRYIAGNDPIDFGSDESSSKGTHSMAATYVIDTVTRDIVAEYIGRPGKADDYYEQLWRGIEYYNGYLLYENNLKGLFTYFKNKNKLYLLADEPQSLKGRSGYNSNNRLKGFHATPTANSYGRELIHTWSLEQIPVGQDENGHVSYIPRMYNIKSKGLLQEIILWSSKGNFDRISSLGALMILLFDRDYETDDTPDIDDRLKEGMFLKVRKMMKKTNKFNFKR